MSDNIEMKPINKEDEDVEETSKMDELMLAEGEDAMIWYSNTPDGKTVFINVGNATVSMPEQVFYELTKLTQQAAKLLLGID